MLFVIDADGVPSQARILRIAAPLPNQSPTVSLVTPTNGSSIVGVVQATANASDPDGLVAKVEFLDNGVVTATDETAPFSASLASVEWVPRDFRTRHRRRRCDGDLDGGVDHRQRRRNDHDEHTRGYDIHHDHTGGNDFYDSKCHVDHAAGTYDHPAAHHDDRGPRNIPSGVR